MQDVCPLGCVYVHIQCVAYARGRVGVHSAASVLAVLLAAAPAACLLWAVEHRVSSSSMLCGRLPWCSEALCVHKAFSTNEDLL